MAPYKHLFFDLDHTLWDFKTNSRLALQLLFEKHIQPVNSKITFNRFYYTYVDINDKWWTQYRVGKVLKSELRSGRFRDSLQRFGIIDEGLTESMASGYVELSPYQTALFPNTISTLEHLESKGFEMHIITNGFEEIQHIKLKESGLSPFFKEIITSEQVSARKPMPEIFAHAMKSSGADVRESLMIGDNLDADIGGAKSFGIDQVFFNPEQNNHNHAPTFEISDLGELKGILK